MLNSTDLRHQQQHLSARAALGRLSCCRRARSAALGETGNLPCRNRLKVERQRFITRIADQPLSSTTMAAIRAAHDDWPVDVQGPRGR
jgi:hypothetical protein